MQLQNSIKQPNILCQCPYNIQYLKVTHKARRGYQSVGQYLYDGHLLSYRCRFRQVLFNSGYNKCLTLIVTFFVVVPGCGPPSKFLLVTAVQ